MLDRIAGAFLFILAVSWLVWVSLPVPVVEPFDLGRYVNATNVKIGDGCSGIVVSMADRLSLSAFHCVKSLISPAGINPNSGYYDEEIVSKGEIRHDFIHDGNIVGGTSYPFRLVAWDEAHDLALLQFDSEFPILTEEVKFMPDGYKLNLGMEVYVVGNPYGMEGTLTQGIISNLNTYFFGVEGPHIMTDAGILNGGSGGALYLKDEMFLIGVVDMVLNAAIRSPFPIPVPLTQYGFAIHIDVVKQFLRENGYARLWMGPDAPAYFPLTKPDGKR